MMASVDVVSDGASMAPEEFVSKFEGPSRPCVLRGLTDDWDASKGRWSVDSLCHRFPSHQWDQGLESGVTTSLKAFLAEHRAGVAVSGDSLEPRRYIFDDTFGEALPELLQDFSIPRIFPKYEEDYLSHLTTLEALRPRYRWLLVGLPGSGFTIHQDPYATSAWNALVEGGAKRWVLLPPDTPLGLVLPSLKGREPAQGGGPAPDAEPRKRQPESEPEVNPNQPQAPPPYWVEPDSEDGNSECGVELPEKEASAAGWFRHVYPSLRARAAEQYGLATDEQLGLLDFLQRPGDVVFIPAGWWHVAVTLPPEDALPGSDACVSVGVTYNYLPGIKFQEALEKLAARPSGASAAYKWCKRAADAGLPQAVRCLSLPSVAAGKPADADDVAASNANAVV